MEVPSNLKDSPSTSDVKEGQKKIVKERLEGKRNRGSLEPWPDDLDEAMSR